MKPYYEDDAVTIYHGDCLEILPTVSADFLLTDPDYGVGMAYGDEPLDAEAAESLLALALSDIHTDHGLMFWSGSWGRLRVIEPLLNNIGWAIKHFGIWYKPNGAGASGNGFARRFETWFWITQDGFEKKVAEWARLPDCIDVSRVHRQMAEGVGHPSQKPEELIRRMVRFFTMPTDTILDPFMGSGTTLRAAKDLGRKAIGIEIEERYCEIAAKRMAQTVMAMDSV